MTIPSPIVTLPEIAPAASVHVLVILNTACWITECMSRQALEDRAVHCAGTEAGCSLYSQPKIHKGVLRTC